MCRGQFSTNISPSSLLMSSTIFEFDAAVSSAVRTTPVRAHPATPPVTPADFAHGVLPAGPLSADLLRRMHRYWQCKGKGTGEH